MQRRGRSARRPITRKTLQTKKKDDSSSNKSTAMMAFLTLLTLVTVFGLVLEFFESKTDTSANNIKNLLTNKDQSNLRSPVLNKDQNAPDKKDILETSQNLYTNSDNNRLEDLTISFEEPPLLDIDGTKLHIIFSTDCSEYQHWQSYVLFFSALQVKQPGHVTRIASGCSDEQIEEAQKWHNEHISSVMSERFLVHFTPHFSTVTKKDGSKGGDYKYFNKPFGLRDWMENGEGMGIDEINGTPLDEDTVVILIDPDQILLRPIRADFTDPNETKHHEKDLTKFPLKVSHGHPIAQKYGLGAQWRKFDLETITGTKDSPAMKVEQREGGQHYPAGPPYLATAKDFYQISLKWTEFAPKVHAEYPHLLAEMYAYCIAVSLIWKCLWNLSE